MSDLQLLLKISRPRFWVYIFGPFLIGLVSAGKSFSELISLESLIFGFYFLFPANLLIYGVNDIFDYETDKLNPKKQNYEILVSPNDRHKLWKYIILSNAPFLIALAFYSSFSVVVFIGFLFFSIFYSAPPIRAKTKPVIDSAFNILYVFPGIFSYVLISGILPSPHIVLAAAFWTLAMHAYSAVPDIRSDRDASLKTIATFLGFNLTLVFCFICYGLAGIISYSVLGMFGVLLCVLYLSIVSVSFIFREKKRIFSIYRIFPVVNTVAGFLIFWIVVYQNFPKWI